MLEHADYSTLATLNRLVVDTCERVEHQKERILSLQRRCREVLAAATGFLTPHSTNLDPGVETVLELAGAGRRCVHVISPTACLGSPEG